MKDQIKEAKNAKSNSSWPVMKYLRESLKNGLIFFFISFLVFFSSSNKILAEEFNWTEIAKTTNGIQFIDTKSIKYNNKGLLSVITKFSEVDPDDQTNINTDIYLMVIDCEKRLFNRLPLNGDPKQIKKLNDPINNKLIKKTIINSCSA